MKKTFILFFFLLFVSSIQAQQKTQTYEGEFNSQKIIFHLNWHSDDNISGTFYYPETLKRYLIKGSYDSNRLLLAQYENNEEIGEFDLLLKRKNNKEILKGTCLNFEEQSKQEVWLQREIKN